MSVKKQDRKMVEHEQRTKASNTFPLVTSSLFTGQSIYNTSHYNMDLDITRSSCGYQNFYNGILQRNYSKMTITYMVIFLITALKTCPFIK